MRKFLNIALSAAALIALALYSWVYYLGVNRIETKAHLGQIASSDFSLCNQERVLQYYSVSTDFEGGKRAIREKILPQINDRSITFGQSEGNINIRFIVNCKGEIGLFRLKSIDKNLQESSFHASQEDALIEIVSHLDNWIAGNIKSSEFDSYYHINFKVREGIIVDIF